MHGKTDCQSFKNEGKDPIKPQKVFGLKALLINEPVHLKLMVEVCQANSIASMREPSRDIWRRACPSFFWPQHPRRKGGRQTEQRRRQNYFFHV
jgi:hypothetical protein